MAACGSLLGRVELSVRNLDSLSRNRQMMKFMTWVDVPDRSRQIDCYRSADPGRQIDCYRGVKNLKSREPRGKNMSYRCFWSNIQGKSWSSSPLLEAGAKRFDASPASSYSTRAASDVTFDGSAKQDQLDNPAVSPDQRVVGERKLRLSSGSCYLPHPAKEETGGEDAHFICVAEQAIGVADGVGGWADLGVDSGLYARELMSHSVSAIQEEPKGSIDPVRVLERAHSSTKARGSSTACIIALTDQASMSPEKVSDDLPSPPATPVDPLFLMPPLAFLVQGINAINLGDSGFMLVRDGSVVFQSPPQQHDFNFPYQLESGNLSDPQFCPGQLVFTVPVAAGDAIVAGTDGLFDNLFGKEVTAVVARAVRDGLGPNAAAEEIAALARRRALDRNGQTPFSTAAQEAGYWYTGGKLDDITVVVSFVTSFDQ